MKNKLLLPFSFKPVGFMLLLLSLALFIAWNNFGVSFHFLDTGGQQAVNDLSFADHNLTNECIALGSLAGLICIAFSRERSEDERVTMIRLQSLQLSHYLSYLLFAIGILWINGLPFLLSLLYLPYLFLVVFLIVFYCRLYLFPKFAAYEK